MIQETTEIVDSTVVYTYSMYRDTEIGRGASYTSSLYYWFILSIPVPGSARAATGSTTGIL